ncbi:MAG: hypothetical protein M3O30_06795 [Planctomycetota bacterium]|nr:hypothetical protein [Planctomycetota bacterium]
MDDFEGDQADPIHLHKYLYAGANPVNNWDPRGHDFGEVLAVASIGALLGTIGTVGINYATGQHHSLVTGALFGAAALPLAIAFPVFGLGLAGYGGYQSWNLTWQVWANPRSTNGQLAASLVIFGTSIFGIYSAGQNVAANGWYNPTFTQPAITSAPPLNASTPLNQLFDGVPDNTMVHGSDAPVGDLAQGVRPSYATGKSYWFRWGDIKNLTVTQYQGLVGGMARGGLPDSNTFVFKLESSTSEGNFELGAKALGFYQEYTSGNTIVPDAGGVVGPKG